MPAARNRYYFIGHTGYVEGLMLMFAATARGGSVPLTERVVSFVAQARS